MTHNGETGDNKVDGASASNTEINADAQMEKVVESVRRFLDDRRCALMLKGSLEISRTSGFVQNPPAPIRSVKAAE
jgi:hypothetical protein